SILPKLTPRELLEVSLIHSVAGDLAGGALTDQRPFRAPPPFGLDGCPCRRRNTGPAWRNLSCPPRGLVSRRIARVPAAGFGQPPPAARNRRSGNRPRKSPRRLSGAVSTRCGDEPLPLRPRQ